MQRQTGLADAARAGQRDERRRSQQGATLGDLALAADEGGQLAGQVAEPPLVGAQGREVRVEAGGRDLVEPLRLGQVLELMLPEIDEGDLGRDIGGHEVAGGLRDEDLPAVAGRADACRTMDVDAHVAGRGLGGLAGVDAHADADVGAVRPLVARDAALSGDGAEECRPGRGEREVEAVAGRALLHAVVLPEGLAEQSMVVGEHGRVPTSQGMEQLGRALDVGEDEGHGPGRDAVHAGRSLTRSVPPRRGGRDTREGPTS